MERFLSRCIATESTSHHGIIDAHVFMHQLLLLTDSCQMLTDHSSNTSPPSNAPCPYSGSTGEGNVLTDRRPWLRFLRELGVVEHAGYAQLWSESTGIRKCEATGRSLRSSIHVTVRYAAKHQRPHEMNMALIRSSRDGVNASCGHSLQRAGQGPPLWPVCALLRCQWHVPRPQPQSCPNQLQHPHHVAL